MSLSTFKYFLTRLREVQNSFQTEASACRLFTLVMLLLLQRCIQERGIEEISSS